MKVIKVIVDELPEICEECLFIEFGWDERGCGLYIPHKLIDVAVYMETRPDWCPLELKEDNG